MRQQMTFSLWLDCGEFMNLHVMELNRSTHMHMHEHTKQDSSEDISGLGNSSEPVL